MERINERKKPRIINTGANEVNLKATNCAVIVVPIFAPNIIPILFLNESTPAFTRLMAMTEVAELDWIKAVTIAPKRRPIPENLVVLDKNFLNFSPVIL